MGAKYFEELKIGEKIVLPPVLITSRARTIHVDIYGEDWPIETLKDATDRQIIPSPMIISIIAGQMGKIQFFRMKFVKNYSVQLLAPIFVGDTITTNCVVKELRPHKDPSKNYGYVFIEQQVLNQNKKICYIRTLCYLVTKKLFSN